MSLRPLLKIVSKRRTYRIHLLAEILFARSSLLSAAFENIYNMLSFRSHGNKLTGYMKRERHLPHANF